MAVTLRYFALHLFRPLDPEKRGSLRSDQLDCGNGNGMNFSVVGAKATVINTLHFPRVYQMPSRSCTNCEFTYTHACARTHTHTHTHTHTFIHLDTHKHRIRNISLLSFPYFIAFTRVRTQICSHPMAGWEPRSHRCGQSTSPTAQRSPYSYPNRCPSEASEKGSADSHCRCKSISCEKGKLSFSFSRLSLSFCLF
jgi:hypothetical protein